MATGSRERVLMALAKKVPDCVPFILSCIDPELQETIVGRKLGDFFLDLNLEPGAMNLDELKATYGQKLCLVGNIDIDGTLSRANPEEVASVIRDRIRQLAPNGGFIISDFNSVSYYCKAENVLAMSKAVEKYRYCYKSKHST